MEAKPLCKRITCFSFNGDHTMVALCPGTSDLYVYAVEGTNTSSWKKVDELSGQHDQLVTGVDWGKKKNRIVSCSQDRNGYVWWNENGKWNPKLVLLRSDRAATCVSWSPEENKFAVGNGAKTVCVCYYEEEHDWWVSKVIRKHSSTVLSVAWHPNNFILATGCADNKCRLFTAAVMAVDKKLPGAKQSGDFGALLAEFDMCSGWILGVGWSLSATLLGFVSFDSTLNIVDLSNKDEDGGFVCQRILCKTLPFTQVIFLSDTSVVCVGHDYNPALFNKDGNDKWSFVKFLDGGEGESEPSSSRSGGSALTKLAFERFRTQAKTGQQSKERSSVVTKHKNLISEIGAFDVADGNVKSFFTSGLDGRMVFWTPEK